MSSNYNHKSKVGFSLIELSIVLIIIGLLVTGIIGGSKLIEQAKVRTVINEIRNYRQAVFIFRVNKDRLPGDLNGSGLIGYDSGQTYQAGDFGYPYDGTDSYYGTPTAPIVVPWVELYLEGVIDFKPINTTPTDRTILAINGALPTSKAFSNLFIYFEHFLNCGDCAAKQGCTNNNKLLFNTFEQGYNVSGKFVRAVDIKFDDGIHNTGIMRGACFSDTANYCLANYTDKNSKCYYFFTDI